MTLNFIAYANEGYRLDGLITNLALQLQITDFSFMRVILTDAAADYERGSYIEGIKDDYKFRIEYVPCPGQSLAECYNKGLELCLDGLAAFVDCDSEYSATCMAKIIKVIEKENLLDIEYFCVEPIFVQPDGKQSRYNVCSSDSGIRDISESAGDINLCLYSYFIKTDILKGIRFREDFPGECRQLFILDIIKNQKRYYCINGKKAYYYHALEDAVSYFVPQHFAKWYTHTLKNCYLPLVKGLYEEGTLTMEVEAVVIYLIAARFACNRNEIDKEAVPDDKLDEFLRVIYDILKYLSYDTIMQTVKLRGYSLSLSLMYDFLKSKISSCGDSFEVRMTSDSVVVNIFSGNQPRLLASRKLFSFSGRNIDIYSVTFESGNLIIDAALPSLPSEWYERVVVSAEGAEVCPLDLYNDTKYFGRTYENKYFFRAYVQIKKDIDVQNISFYAGFGEAVCKMHLAFKKPQSRLAASMDGIYWHFGGDRILKYSNFRRELQITRCSAEDVDVLEANYCLTIRHDSSITKRERRSILSVRKYYWEDFYNKNNRKPIWITFDKLYKAGDNGEYIYHYVRDNCPDIDIYYIINESSCDYERLRGDDHVLIYGSELQRKIAICADVILATHVNIMVYCGFTSGKMRTYLRDLFNGRIVCIQHGLTVQDIAIFQNIAYDNTRLYCCASKYEVSNILQPAYGYSRQQVSLTGLARFDGLKNDDKRQILISPTWRRNIVNGGVACERKSHNDYFKNSEYYRIYNSLINDAKLISTAKKCGYNIIYLLHPAMSAQIEDYEKNDYVQLMAAASDMSYEKILTHSSLMVTDYSGVQFDFAYMRKPVVYYHPSTLQPHYDESEYFRYDTMGFGPVVTEYTDLIDTLCSYIEDDCRMRQEYKLRADDFFAYDDHDNCRRIYEIIRSWDEDDRNERVSSPIMQQNKAKIRRQERIQLRYERLENRNTTLRINNNRLKEKNEGLRKKNISLKEKNEKLKEKNLLLAGRIQELKKQNNSIKKSWSWRIGRIITWIPRKLRSAFSGSQNVR